MTDFDKRLSFCIPIMNRLDDIKVTLRQNLDDNFEDKHNVEFIVVCFDKNNLVKKWIFDNFKKELDCAYLRFYHLESELDFWHFGKAKNIFKNYIRGSIYASLDGDNFTGKRGGKQIIDVFVKYNYTCIFHQFQGDWGDGTCGRISLSTTHYLKYGYDANFLPRQWDELDAMLTVMVNEPDVVYISYSGKSIIDKSQPFKQFLLDNDIVYKTDFVCNDSKEHCNVPISTGKHDSDYVRNDDLLRFSSKFNHLLSFIKNTKNKALNDKYHHEIISIQQELIDKVSIDDLFPQVLKTNTINVKKHNYNDVCLVSCVKDEQDLLAWYKHYKSLGVKHFFIVDDYSQTAVEELLDFADVSVFTPLVGNFKHAKVFWLELILTRYCKGSWVYIVDSDEYIELPNIDQINNHIANRTLAFVKDNKNYYCGFLLDLFPISVDAQEEFSLNHCNYYQYRSPILASSYHQNNTVKWSYGKNSPWAYSIDVRYKVNRSFDSLRKFPLVKWQRGMHLNQGFHDLIIDKEKRSWKETNRKDLLVIKHYKFLSIKYREFDNYFGETKINHERLRSRLENIFKDDILNHDSYQFLSPSLVPTPARTSIYLINKNETDNKYLKKIKDDVVFYFIKSNAKIEIIGHSISALRLIDAVSFISKYTPFKKIEKVDKNCYKLSIRFRVRHSWFFSRWL